MVAGLAGWCGVIVRVSRGSGMTGLMRYLAGPGKRNEHTEPHLVAGDGAVMAWWDDAQLDGDAASRIGAHLDGARRVTGTEVPGGHVWHCSLSLPAVDGQLADERWAGITAEFVDRMGFGAGGGKVPCRWAAVRHGVSTSGNDHVHVVVSLVRDDGTKADVWRDYARAGQAAQAIEAAQGLTVIESRQLGRGARGVSGAEVNKAARLGEPEPARAGVARVVRAVSVAAVDEAEFVRRARLAGLLVRPRFAAGTTDVVVGYSAAVRPVRGERPVWFGGGRLDRDLTLPRLREGWADTPQAATAAAAEWTAAARHRRPVAPGAEAQGVDGAQLEAARAELAALRDRVAGVPVTDHGAWARTAADTAGVLGALSARVEAVPGPIARTADQLARSAQLRSTAPRSTGLRPSAVRRVAALLAQANRDVPDAVRDALLLRELIGAARAVHTAAQAAGDARQARALADTVRHDLLRSHLFDPARTPAPAPATVGAGPGRQPAHRPVPALAPPVPGAVDPAAAEAARRLARARADAPSPAVTRTPGRTVTSSTPRTPGVPDPDSGLDR